MTQGFENIDPGQFWKHFLDTGFLDRWLESPNASGQGVKVAILDVGINESQLSVKRKAGGNILQMQFLPGGILKNPSNHPPFSSHGTIVADTLLRIAPQVEILSADIFGNAFHSTAEQLIHAMRYAIHEGNCKIINLSLGLPEDRIPHPSRKLQLLHVLEEAYEKDVLVFAAGNNDHPFQTSYPAKYESSLFSVNKKSIPELMKYRYQPAEGLEFIGHGVAPLAPMGTDPATSWATAYLSGYAARIVSLYPGIKPFEMKSILYWISREYEGRKK